MRIWKSLRRLLKSLPDQPMLVELKKLLPAPHVPHSSNTGARDVVLMQCVADAYFFSLFAELSAALKQRASFEMSLFALRSVDGAIGRGWRQSLRRCFPVSGLTTRQWLNMYDGISCEVGYRSVSWGHPWLDLQAWVKAQRAWRGLRTLADLESITVDGMACGDLIIDTYLRFRPAETPVLEDPFLAGVIWQAYRDVARSRLYFRKVSPRLYITSFSTYVQHGIAVRVALEAGCEVVAFGNLQELGKRLSIHDSYHTRNPGRYKLDFEARTDKQRLLDRAKEQLEVRLSGGIDGATAYMKVSAYAQGDVDCPDVEGAVVIFLHDFFDSPHVYPGIIFSDFWQWICFTIRTLRRSGIKFYLKPHPNQVGMNEPVLQRLREAFPFIQFIASAVTNRQLAQGGMRCAVTVYGTVAHEVAYLGVPSIACASHPHLAFSFCHTALTVDEYAQLLSRADTLRFADPAAMRQEVLAFYAMHNLALEDAQLKARDALVDLWRICLRSDASAVEIASQARLLGSSEGFGQLADQLVLAAGLTRRSAAPNLRMPA